MSNQIILKTVPKVKQGKDAHLRANNLPAVTGSEDAELLCGGCQAVVCEGASPQALHQRYATDQRLLLECVCGALNVIPKT